MKILISESQLKNLKEISGQFADETEVIYKDKNLVCLIPKSQMSSLMYGKGTKWCQIRQPGFDLWSRSGLLIRFIFRGGKKIRFTYFFPGSGRKQENEDYYWANENGFHVLHGEGNPFDAKTRRDRIRDTELDILAYIKIIPEECRNKVLKFINQNRKEYEYCYRDKEYILPKIKQNREKYFDFVNRYGEKLHKMDIQFYYDADLNKYEIMNYNTPGSYEDRLETYYDLDSFQRRATELLIQTPINKNR